MPPDHRPDAGDGPACLLINPRSFLAARKSLWRQAAEIAKLHGTPVRVESDPEGFFSAMDEFSVLRPTRVIILGGDGTLQGLLSACHHRGALEGLPPLMKLGGGRTNLIAANVKGTGGDVTGKLERTLAAPAQAAALKPVHTFVVSDDENPPEVGLFLAGAMIDDVIRGLHSYRDGQQGRWRDGTPATLLWLARRAGFALSGIRPFARPELEIEAERLGALSGPMRLMLLSTLDRIGPGIEPYADHGEGALRVLAARTGAHRFWLRLPALARGRYSRDMNPRTGYLSGRCDEARLEGLHHYCIDGQEFESRSGTVTIRSGPRVWFEEPAS